MLIRLGYVGRSAHDGTPGGIRSSGPPRLSAPLSLGPPKGHPQRPKSAPAMSFEVSSTARTGRAAAGLEAVERAGWDQAQVRAVRFHSRGNDRCCGGFRQTRFVTRAQPASPARGALRGAPCGASRGHRQAFDDSAAKAESCQSGQDAPIVVEPKADQGHGWYVGAGGDVHVEAPDRCAAITVRPSLTQPSRPACRDWNAERLEVWVFETNRAPWISSFMTTKAPSPRAEYLRRPARQPGDWQAHRLLGATDLAWLR